MGYISKRSKRPGEQRSLEQIFGQESFRDSLGHEWFVKSFQLGEQIKFRNILAEFFQGPEEPTRQIAFLQSVLYNPTPTLLQRLKGSLGLPHYSRKYLWRVVRVKDFEGFLNAVIVANYDMPLDEFVEKVRKEAERSGQKKNNMMLE